MTQKKREEKRYFPFSRQVHPHRVFLCRAIILSFDYKGIGKLGAERCTELKQRFQVTALVPRIRSAP